MTYGQVKRAALRLMNASTVAGSEIPLSYNGQADLVKALPSLVDDAVMQIATTVKRIPAAAPLSGLERTENGLYLLPEDCWRMQGGGLLQPETGLRFQNYRLLGRQLLLQDAPAGLWLEYWRYPHTVGSEPGDDAPLDNTPDTHTALPYFAASQLLLYDDPYRYAALHNEWESRLQRLGEAVSAGKEPIGDAYAGFACGGDW